MGKMRGVCPAPLDIWAYRLVALAFAAGSFLPASSTWGFNHLSYLSVGWQVICCAASAILWLNSPIERVLKAAKPALLRLSLPPLLLCATGAAVAGAAFVLLRTRTHFLGDGYLLIEALARPDGDRPLSSLAYVVLKKFAQATVQYGWNSLMCYRASAVASGLACIGINYWLLRRSRWPKSQQMAFWVLAGSSGATLMFFGYVENYSWALCFLTAYALSGTLYLEKAVGVAVPSALLFLATASHAGSIVALPSAVVLAFAWQPRRPLRGALLLCGPSLVLIGAILAVSAGHGAGGIANSALDGLRLVDPIRPLLGEYGILSIRTLVDVVNLILLIAAMPVALAVAAFVGRSKNLTRSKAWFFSVYVLAVVAAAILVRPALGAARDWDLLAPHAGAMCLLGVAATQWTRSGVAWSLWCGAISFVPWLALANNVPASIARLEAVAAAFPPHARAYAYESLGTYLREEGQPSQVVEMYERAVAALPQHARFHALLGAALVTEFNASESAGAPREELMSRAEEQYAMAHTLRPGVVPVMDNLARLRVRRGDCAGARALILQIAADRRLTSSQQMILDYCGDGGAGSRR